MLKITQLLFFFFFVSVVFTRHKAFTQFTLPPINQHPFTGSIWRCQLLQDVGNCNFPGIYAVFSQNAATVESTILPPITKRILRNVQVPMDANHIQNVYALPLVYVGRSIDGVYGRIRINARRFGWNENDIVCHLRFPPNQGYLNSNDVTPVEQMLLQAFASTGNSFDNQGISYRDTNFIWNAFGSSSSGIIQPQEISFGNLQLPLHLQPHLKNSTSGKYVSNRPSLKEIFNEGIPYYNGEVFDGDWCSNTKKHKSTSLGYIDRIKRLIAEYYMVSSVSNKNDPERNGNENDKTDLPITNKKGPKSTSSGASSTSSNIGWLTASGSISVGHDGNSINHHPELLIAKSSILEERGFQSLDSTSDGCPKCPKCPPDCRRCPMCLDCKHICEPCIKGHCSPGASCAPGGVCYGRTGSKYYVPSEIAHGGACASGGDCTPGGNCFRGDIHHPPGDCANGKINKSNVCGEYYSKTLDCEGEAKDCNDNIGNMCKELKNKLSGIRHIIFKEELKSTFHKYCK
ncbi:hypothetical protein ACTA71_001238 [Dictyostelium dimigraforme]